MKQRKKTSWAKLSIIGGSVCLLVGVVFLISWLLGYEKSVFLLPGILLLSSGTTFIALGAEIVPKKTT